MNRERVEKLRDFLRDEVPDERFNMRFVTRRGQTGPELAGAPWLVLKECGTAACIAGWADFLFHERGGCDVLDLSWDAIEALETPPGYNRHPRRFTRAMAVDTLTRLLETGEVRWSAPELPQNGSAPQSSADQ